MESEYIALSLAMRELITVQVVLMETFTHVFHSPNTKVTYATIAKAFKMPILTVYEDNEACLKFASMSKCLLIQNILPFPIISSIIKFKN